MPRIDPYLANLERHGAQAMVLASDQPIELDRGGDIKRLRKSCSADEILTLVNEVMDSVARQQLVVDGNARFAYRSEQIGPLSIAVEKRGNRVRCEVHRARGSREPVDG